MCNNTRLVSTPRGSIRISCGHCEACLQEKAERNSKLIHNNYDNDVTVLFVTLTYHNDCIPFVSKDDDDIFTYGNDYLDEGEEINVYRHCTSRLVSTSFGSSSVVNQRVLNLHRLGSFISKENFSDKDIKYLRCYNKVDKYKYHREIGVLWYPDIQKFIKRLRINALRNGYTDYFQVYYIGEYGETTHRPHFHVLLYLRGFRQNDLQKWKYLCSKSWLYDDGCRTYDNVEIARSPARYVGSYLGCTSFIPPFLRQKPICPKARHSKYFGLRPDAFSAKNVTSAVERKCLEYDVQRVGKNVKVSTESIPIPSYVLRNYFPKIKGYSGLTDDEVRHIYSHPSSLSAYAKKLGYTEHLSVVKDSSGRQVLDNKGTQKLLYRSDITQNRHLIDNAFVRWYNSIYGDIGLASADEIYVARSRYAFAVCDCWKLRASQLIQRNYLDVETADDFIDAYDNWQEVVENSKLYKNVISSFPDSVIRLLDRRSLDPNSQIKRCRKSEDLSLRFHQFSKEHKIKDRFIVDDWQHNSVYF